MNIDTQKDKGPISYQNMVNALSIMTLLQISEKSIQVGTVYDNEEVFSNLRSKIESKNA
jgi:hypothetical protein